MTAVARKDIIETLGPVDDVVIATIIDMGTTAQELAEAKAWIANDEAFMNAGRPLAGGRVGRIVDLIASLAEEEDEEIAGRG